MLFRFQFELSDIDRGVYETLDARLAQHPSETPTYLVTRALAYALAWEPGLEFSAGGLAEPEAPALQNVQTNGGYQLWIEIGNPSSRKLHKAAKTSRRVVVYTYKNPEVLAAALRTDEVHRAGEIEIYAFEAGFLAELETRLQKTNRWSLLVQEGRLDVTGAGFAASTEVRRIQ